MAGVTLLGFEQKTLEEILDELGIDQRATVDPAIDTSSESPVGQMNGIFANQLAEAWEAISTAYKAFDPDSAEGDALEALSALTGTSRNSATKTLVIRVRVSVGALFNAAAGTMVAHLTNDSGTRFINVDEVDHPGGAPTDLLVSFEAEDTGPTVVNSLALNVIAEPLTGWTAITNNQAPSDNSETVVGSAIQTDQDLRVSREEEFRGGGGATQAAIDAALEAIEGVVSVTVFVNDQDLPDSDGVPGHAIECLIFDGDVPSADNTVIAQAILDTKAAGIQAFGSESHDAIDVEGNTISMSFTRPALIQIYIEVDVTQDTANLNQEVITAGEAAVVARGISTATPGRDVIQQELACAAIDVTGVLDVPALRLGVSASPVNEDNLAIQSRELATYSVARVDVTIV